MNAKLKAKGKFACYNLSRFKLVNKSRWAMDKPKLYSVQS